MTPKLSPPVARDLLNPSVKCVAPDLSLQNLVDFFLKYEHSCAPVTEAGAPQGLLLGFVSQGDALSSLSHQMFEGFPRQELHVHHVMKKHPLAITPDTDVFSIASILNSHGFRHVPVVDSNQKLVGLVSRREVLKALAKYTDAVGREDEREHFRPDVHQIMNHRFIVAGR